MTQPDPANHSAVWSFSPFIGPLRVMLCRTRKLLFVCVYVLWFTSWVEMSNWTTDQVWKSHFSFSELKCALYFRVSLEHLFQSAAETKNVFYELMYAHESWQSKFHELIHLSWHSFVFSLQGDGEHRQCCSAETTGSFSSGWETRYRGHIWQASWNWLLCFFIWKNGEGFIPRHAEGKVSSCGISIKLDLLNLKL